MKILSQYIYNLALAHIQLLNVYLGGDPDGSISARLGYAMKTGRPKFWVLPLALLNDVIHYQLSGEINHSENAIEPDETYDKEVWHWYHEEGK